MKAKRIVIISSIIVVLIAAFLLINSKISRTIPLTEQEAIRYEAYKIKLPDELINSGADVIEFLLMDCEIIQEQTIDNLDTITYTFGNITDYLSMSHEISEVSTYHDVIAIDYYSVNNERVALLYKSDGFHQMAIYNEDSDEIISITRDENIRYTNVWRGWF